MRLSLKNKLTLSIIGVILFFGSLSVVFVFFKFKDSLVLQAEQELQAVSSVQAQGVASIFRGGSNLVENIAKDELLVEYMLAKRSTSIVVNSASPGSVGSQTKISDDVIYQRLVQYNIGNHYSAIYLLGVDGTTYVSTDETFVNQNYGFRDYFQKAAVGEPWVEVAIGVTSKRVGYYFSCPISNAGGDIIGVAVAKMIPDYVHQFIIDNDVGGDEVVMFADYNGVVIYSNDEARIYKSLGVLSENQLNSIKEKKNFSNIDIQPLGYSEVQQSLSRIGGYKIFNIQDEVDQKFEVVSVVKIKDLPFYLVVERGLDQFVGPSIRISYLLSCFVLLMILGSIITIVYFVNRFLQPLQILKNGADQVSKENFEYKIDIKTGDELEVLGTAFNKMLSKLKASYHDLNKQVEKLETMNRLMVGREKKMVELKKQIKKYQE